MSYTILQPTFFSEVWLGPALGFDAAGGTARIYGAGENKVSWISLYDVARFAASAASDATAPQSRNAVIELGGPEALSPLEVVRLAEQATGKTFIVEHVPEEALRAQYESADDPLQKSFAALMLYCARCEPIDMDATLRDFRLEPLKTVAEHLAAATAPNV